VNLPKNKEVKYMAQDPAGNMWLGSNDELIVLDKNQKAIHRYSASDSLADAHIYGMLSDNDGSIWFSHNKGISVYRWKEKRFEHFNKEDGLQSTEFNISACYRTKEGELFFGGINGVTAFFPNQIRRNPHAPAVNITNIKVFDEPLKSDSAYWTVRKLVLPYTENSISFEYALPEFSNPQQNQYAYTMENVDGNWIHAGDKRFARYPGLNPGHYVFRVKGANHDGTWSSGPTSVEITIIPPFWKRAWFIVMAIVFFILLSVGIGIYIQKIRQRKAIQALELQHKIQLERERISRDLHDNVGTQLSLISKNIEGVIDPENAISDTERLRNLKNISQTSKEVIFTLRETIWALNREEISLEELSDKLKGFAQKLFGLNRDCTLNFTEELENESVVLTPSEAIHLFRICQEAITNSLKYANAANMQVRIDSVAGKYQVTIADDGIGFDRSAPKTSVPYGLDNMKYRAEEIQCTFTIETAPGKGTRIVIHKK
jgi:signal transduction histidine kinase